MEPEVVDGYGSLVLELIGPLATVLVLRVFPFRSYALFEEVVIGLETEFRGRSNVVLDRKEKE